MAKPGTANTSHCAEYTFSNPAQCGTHLITEQWADKNHSRSSNRKRNNRYWCYRRSRDCYFYHCQPYQHYASPSSTYCSAHVSCSLVFSYHRVKDPHHPICASNSTNSCPSTSPPTPDGASPDDSIRPANHPCSPTFSYSSSYSS